MAMRHVFRPMLERFEDRCVPATITVKNLWDDGSAGCLRSAVAAANALPNADTIVFKPGLEGTIVLTDGEIVIKENLTVLGPGANKIAVSGNFASRIFNIENAGADLTVKLQGLELRHGQAGASDGGAIYSTENLTLTKMVFTLNQAEYGGAIISTGDLKIAKSTISGNTALFGGGGIYSDGTATITGSTIAGNKAGSFGGGIAGNKTTIIGSTIAGNSAATEGGGIRVFGPSEIRNSTISGNRAGINGGSIHSNAAGLKLRNCTIAFNQAGGKGGGIAIEDSSPILESCLIADNTAMTGKNLASLTGPEIFHLDRCLISLYADGDATLQDSGTTPITTLSPGNNIFNLDAKLAPLAINGGKTQTHALKKGSPAINAGSNPAGLTTDQRGAPFKRRLGGFADIGAYERQ